MENLYKELRALCDDAYVNEDFRIKLAKILSNNIKQYNCQHVVSGLEWEHVSLDKDLYERITKEKMWDYVAKKLSENYTITEQDDEYGKTYRLKIYVVEEKQ